LGSLNFLKRASVEAAITAMENCATKEPRPAPVAPATLESPTGASPLPPVDAGPSSEPEHHGRTWLMLGTAAAGVAMLTTGALLDRSVSQDSDALFARCRTACSDDELSSLSHRADLSYAVMAAGGVAIAASVALYLWPRSHHDASSARVSVAPGGLVLHAMF
jgi:hypothetical protein